MKKLLTIFIVLTLWASGSLASVNGYWFTTASGSFVTTPGMVLGTANNDDEVFIDPAGIGLPPGSTGPGIPIGFTFNYNDNDCDIFGVNTNGWIVVGSGSITVGSGTIPNQNYVPISATGPTGFVNAISALGMNLQSLTGAGQLCYLTDGVAPFRVLIVQWTYYKYYGSTGSGDNFNFQIKLYETTNQIEFVYGNFTKNSTTRYPQVGIRGATNADFHNRTTTSNWANTAQGTANNQTCVLSTSIKPGNGLIFRFGPYYDFGDAPDIYFTKLVNNGARHTNTGLKMGPQIDVEMDGQPNGTATGDDLANLDDEDGVWWPFNFVPGMGT